MADSVSSGVEDVDVEEIGSDDEGSSEEQEDTENYNLEEGGEGTEDGDELQPLQLEVEEEGEEGEGEEVEEQQEEEGEGIDFQALSDMLRVEVDVLKSLVEIDHFPHVLNNVVQLLSEKTSLVDQYETTLHQFSESLSSTDETLRELLAF